MKKVLVVGAAGCIGMYVIKYLLSEGKYEITALDLKNNQSVKRLKKYRRRINIIYGDINEPILMESLVKEHDVIINLATVLPPLSDLNKNIGHLVEYEGTENIIKAINYYNSKCFLIYASTTSLYDASLSANVLEKIKERELSGYNLAKFQTENLIRQKLKNYCILRVPLVLNESSLEHFMFNIKKNSLIEVTTDKDAAYAFVKTIDHQKEVNKKIFNIGLGQDGRIIYQELLTNILKYHGLSLAYLFGRVFLEKNYYSPVLTDSDNLEEIIHYRNDSLYNYYRRLEKQSQKRKIAKILAKPLIYFKNKG